MVGKILVKCVPYVARLVGMWADAKDRLRRPRRRPAHASLRAELRDEHHRPRSAHSPEDQEALVSSAVRGTQLQGAFVPYQSGAMRPIP